MTETFAGRHALVIGGGRNIGRAVVAEFARRGARLSVADLDREGAEEAAALIRDAGGEAAAFACDVTSDQSVADCIAGAEAAFGPIDVLMNNAGILSGGNPEDIALPAWQQMMDVNLFGMVRAINLVLPGMLARCDGHIVNTASFAGLYPFATSRVHYAASKAAVVSLSENLALYGLDHGVRVSCLCPGPVMTTSVQGMKHFSEDYTMRAPGSHLLVQTQERVAITLADGMQAGRILIPTHEELWPIYERLGQGPDAFIHAKHAEFAAGDSGRPGMSDELIAQLRADGKI